VCAANDATKISPIRMPCLAIAICYREKGAGNLNAGATFESVGEHG
jgi:hypothetical protein